MEVCDRDNVVKFVSFVDLEVGYVIFDVEGGEGEGGGGFYGEWWVGRMWRGRYVDGIVGESDEGCWVRMEGCGFG